MQDKAFKRFMPPISVFLVVTSLFGSAIRANAAEKQPATISSTIKLAILAPLTGPVPTFGRSARDGALLAIAQQNASGGILGMTVEPITEDTACNAAMAVNATNKVINQDGVRYIIGDVCSGSSIAMSEITNAAGVIQMTPTATNPRVTVDSDGVNLVTRQAKERGITTPFVGGDGWDSSDLDTAAASGSYFTTNHNPNKSAAVMRVQTDGVHFFALISPDVPAPRLLPSGRIGIALGAEPSTLYVYNFGGNALISQALMDGPITTADYDYQPVILTKLPRPEDGDLAVVQTTVVSGTRVMLSNGSVVTYTGPVTAFAQMMITFTLRNDVRWSDGTPLTSQDAVFGQSVACHPDTPMGFDCGYTVAYTAPTSYTTRWVGLPGFVDGYTQYPSYFATPLPYHVLSGTTPLQIANGSYGRNPLGWGPYKIAEWVAGSHITLVRNPYYWRPGYPIIDQLVFRWYNADPIAVRAAIDAGDVQVVPQLSYVTPQDMQVLALATGMRFVPAASQTYEHLDFGIMPSDGRFAFFADKSLRQAVAYAVNRQRLIDEAFGGLGTIAQAIVSPEHPVYTAALRTYPYSPTLAANLLTAAGWVDTNGNGIRDKDGREFIITHTTTNANVRQIMGVALADDLRAVGISVTLCFTDGNSYFGPDSPLNHRRFDTTQFAWVNEAYPGFGLFASNNIPADTNGWSGQNYPGYINPVYDDLLGRFYHASTRAEAITLGQRMVISLSEDMPTLPLLYRPTGMLAHPALNPGPSLKLPEQELWNVWQWGDQSASIVAAPGVMSVLTTTGTFTATWPAGAVADTTAISYSLRFRSGAGGNLAAVTVYDLRASSLATGEPITRTQAAYTVTIGYTLADKGAAIEGTLALYYWDDISGRWVREPTSAVDPAARIVTAMPNHFSRWAVLGETRHIYLPLIVR